MKQKKRTPATYLVSQEAIESRILLIRSKKVMLDADLAKLYGVTTKRLNEQVKRNKRRFPEDFMFRLTVIERDELVANCDRLEQLKHSSSFPCAFTEQGIAMLSSILNSECAILANIQIMRTFTKIRELLLTHAELRQKIESMEKKYDQRFKIVFEAIRQILTPPEKPKRRIGFHSG